MNELCVTPQGQLRSKINIPLYGLWLVSYKQVMKTIDLTLYIFQVMSHLSVLDFCLTYQGHPRLEVNMLLYAHGGVSWVQTCYQISG